MSSSARPVNARSNEINIGVKCDFNKIIIRILNTSNLYGGLPAPYRVFGTTSSIKKTVKNYQYEYMHGTALIAALAFRSNISFGRFLAPL